MTRPKPWPILQQRGRCTRLFFFSSNFSLRTWRFGFSFFFFRSQSVTVIRPWWVRAWSRCSSWTPTADSCTTTWWCARKRSCRKCRNRCPSASSWTPAPKPTTWPSGWLGSTPVTPTSSRWTSEFFTETHAFVSRWSDDFFFFGFRVGSFNSILGTNQITYKPLKFFFSFNTNDILKLKTTYNINRKPSTKRLYGGALYCVINRFLANFVKRYFAVRNVMFVFLALITVTWLH